MTSKIMLSKFALSKAVLHQKGAHSMCWPQVAGVLTTVYCCGFQSLSTVLFTQAALTEIQLLSLPVTLEGAVG